jgi:hypothetical protein
VLCLQVFTQPAQARRSNLKPVEGLLANLFQHGFIRMRRSAKEPLLQVAAAVDLMHGPDDVGDDPSRCGQAAAVKEGVAKSFCAFADRSVYLTLLVARCAGGHQAQRDGALPVRVAAGIVGERRRISTTIQSGEVMGEAAVL